jgi:hypothetical protein
VAAISSKHSSILLKFSYTENLLKFMDDFENLFSKNEILNMIFDITVGMFNNIKMKVRLGTHSEQLLVSYYRN